MRVVAATTHCAFWDRKLWDASQTSSDSSSSSSTTNGNNIGDGGSVVGANGHGLPPMHPGSSINSASTDFAAGISESLHTLKQHYNRESDVMGDETQSDIHIEKADSDNGAGYVRIYTISMIFAGSFALFVVARRMLGPRSEEEEGEYGSGGMVSLRRGNWARNQNFQKVPTTSHV